MIPIDTIVSIKSGDEYGGKYTGKLGIIKKFTDDPYAGFCAAVTKRVFGSTSQAKKVLARTRKETSK